MPSGPAGAALTSDRALRPAGAAGGREVVIGDGGFLYELEKRGYVKAGPWTPEASVQFPEAGEVTQDCLIIILINLHHIISAAYKIYITLPISTLR